MKGLYSHGFAVPRPYGYNRHAIIMEYIQSYPMNRVEEIKDKETVYHKMMDFISKLGENGLIHGDFNEFNILLNVNKPDEIVVIDFPQMISIHHSEAENYFKRDVQCVKNFFIKKFNITFAEDLKFEDIKQINYLDRELKAYGYIKEKKIKNKKRKKYNINMSKTYSKTSTNFFRPKNLPTLESPQIYPTHHPVLEYRRFPPIMKANTGINPDNILKNFK